MSEYERARIAKISGLSTMIEKQAAIVPLFDLIRRAKANEVTILSAIRHESGQGERKQLVTYAAQRRVKHCENFLIAWL